MDDLNKVRNANFDKKMSCVLLVNHRLTPYCGYTEDGWRPDRLPKCPQCGKGTLFRVKVELYCG